MILMGYIILGHPDWRKGKIKIFAVYPEGEIENQRKYLLKSIKTGQLPISPTNIRLIPQKEDESIHDIVCTNSEDSDLTIVGFREEQVKNQGAKLFTGYGDIGSILFVNTTRKMDITKE
mgnify:CR=1 FL=1